ncbi:hypothetical protein PAPYR_10472 [Paratrimastix pyriformis]|uniref:Uncharacterized protein n=1 Tax=Paratrimastix pyriformis TaxID=342808 RepID=A0ABQ8UBJ8_9EUKA|nr:hypothetical protein PAPYR_10472 [Paratrimastix pyriformis]
MIESQSTTSRKIREDLVAHLPADATSTSLRDFEPVYRVFSLPQPLLDLINQWFEKTSEMYEDHRVPVNRVTSYSTALFLHVQFMPDKGHKPAS